MDVLMLAWDDVSRVDATPEVCPSLAAFRAQGLDLRLAFANPVCSQSRAVVTFGAQGRTLGILLAMNPEEPDGPIPPASWPTLPGVLAGAGYATALVGKWHLGRAPSGAQPAMAPIERGYQTWLAGTLANLAPPDPPLGLPSYRRWLRHDATAAGWTAAEETKYATLAQVEEAEAWWVANAGAPRFLHVSLNEPHGPFTLGIPSELLAGWPAPTTMSNTRARFLAKLRAADVVLGRLLALPGVEDALVLLYADNGTASHAAGPTEDPEKLKTTTFEGGIHVPAASRYPGGPVGGSYGQLVHLVDLPRFVLETLGVPVPAEWDGVTQPPRTHVIAEAELADGTLEQCARIADWKLRARTPPGGTKLEELYDLANDPSEVSPVPLGQANPTLLAGLRSVLYPAP